MTTGSTLATLPGSKPGQRVEVVLNTSQNGELSFELREQHYAEGIGWFDQRALALEPEQLRRLRHFLRPELLGDPMIGKPNTEKGPSILPFPGPSTTRRPHFADRA